jgi:archaellum component FlaC
MIASEDQIIILLKGLTNEINTLKAKNHELLIFADEVVNDFGKLKDTNHELETELEELKEDYRKLARTKNVTSITVSSSSGTMTVSSQKST